MKMLIDVPALEINGIIAAGDLHIGIEQKLSGAGLNFPDIGTKLAGKIVTSFASSKARGVVLLGDIKDAIGWPTADAYASLQKFFYGIRNVDVRIANGNHDAHLQELLNRMGYGIKVEPEVRIGDTTFLHGNAMPSYEAMQGDYIVEAHGHLAVSIAGIRKKVFVIAEIGNSAHFSYKHFNKRAKLILVPPLNPLILGNAIDYSTKKHLPIFRNEIFDFEGARVYAGGLLGRVRDFL
ncbi:MAG: metallophosphoesterase [Candidatus Micrarchaeaceae archaeon]